jgi:hypothetical protein
VCTNPRSASNVYLLVREKTTLSPNEENDRPGKWHEANMNALRSITEMTAMEATLETGFPPMNPLETSLSSTVFQDIIRHTAEAEPEAVEPKAMEAGAVLARVVLARGVQAVFLTTVIESRMRQPW